MKTQEMNSERKMLSVCVYIQVTRKQNGVPIIVTMHVETVALLVAEADSAEKDLTLLVCQ